ncbi:MAG: hypothetical protein Q9160_001692 [Pyrenula sp. 1 TL-2023]
MPSQPDAPASPAQAPLSAKSQILETGASIVQDFKPIKQICAHLNAFHVYADDPGRCVEANHYCSHLNEDLRQCMIYDDKKERLIGVEYLISDKLFKMLSLAERKLWHTHTFEVRSGMLVLPQPSTSALPSAAWETAETSEMRDILPLYGKTYHFWEVDKGDPVPLGQPKLMASFRNEEDVERVVGLGEGKASERLCRARDEAYKISTKSKRELRERELQTGGGDVAGEHLRIINTR